MLVYRYGTPQRSAAEVLASVFCGVMLVICAAALVADVLIRMGAG